MNNDKGKLKDNKLVKQLQEDDKLEKDTKLEYISLAKIYLNNFMDNLNKTSLELNEETPVGIDTWKDFLSYPLVKRYIKSFMNEKFEQIADKNLLDGDKGALAIKKSLQDETTANNSNIILIRLPEQEDFS